MARTGCPGRQGPPPLRPELKITAGGGGPAPGSYSRKEGYNMKKQNATDAYVAVIAEISAKLDAIKAQAVDNHLGVSPDAVNWGNVGTAQHLLAVLAEAAEIAGV